jgi:xylulokinase
VAALVGLDVGTTAVKALAIDPGGTVLARAEVGYPLSTPRPGWAEQDPDEWVRASEAALAELGIEPAAVGLSGQMHGLVALDRDDRPLRPAILWNDQRTAAECAEIERCVGRERLLELTGNLALPGFTAPKLLWMRANEPRAFARIRSVLLPKDYVRLKLFGVRACDAADASGTLLFDVAGRRWSEEILAILDLPGEWLPPVFESPSVPGAPGAGDQAAAALGVGVAAPGPVSVALGTSGVVFATLPSLPSRRDGRTHLFCHAVPGRWHAMGVMLSAAGALRWLRDCTAPGMSFEQLLAEAEGWPPGAEGLLFAPYLAGERTPYADPEARGAFVGLALRHDRGAMVRAVLEGVAYGLRDSLELIRMLETEPTVGRLTGGGARSPLWRRIVASVLGLPLERVAVEEGSAYGAALLAGCASGSFDSVEEAASRVRATDRVEPDPAWSEAYAQDYLRFRRLYPALAEFRSIDK